VVVRRRDPDAPGCDPISLDGLADLERSPPTEDLGHQAPVPAVEVLDQDDRGPEVGRERGQDLAQGLQAPGRGRQGDHLERGAGLGRLDHPGPTFPGEKPGGSALRAVSVSIPPADAL
jgi:hypothetical protein